MKEEKKYLTLEEILDDQATEDLYIEALDRWVTIRNATTKDRLEAEKEARLHPAWDQMDAFEQAREFARMLALKILVRPKIDRETYLKTKQAYMDVILDAVARHYAEKISKLTEKRYEEVRRFLEQKMVKEVESSTRS